MLIYQSIIKPPSPNNKSKSPSMHLQVYHHGNISLQ